MPNEINIPATGQCPPKASASHGGNVNNQFVTPSSASHKELIERYYIKFLKNMKGDEAFICLSICFLLYEKYLKFMGEIKDNEKFTMGHSVFEFLGSEWGVSKDHAFLIWRDWRNGLLHKGMPLINQKIKWILRGDAKKIITVTNNFEFTLNPWLLRDKIIKKVEKKEIWKDSSAPLMLEYEIRNL